MISRQLLLLLLAAITSLVPISNTAGRAVESASDALPAMTDRVGNQTLAADSARSVEAAAGVDVAIQAGHWKANELPEALAHLRGSTGAYGGGRTEAQVTLDIAQRVARILRGQGLTVEVLPATVPTGYQADLFISLHADGNSSSQARGYKVSTRWRSEVAALDALLVQSLEEAYGSIVRLPRDGNITRAMRGYYAYSTYRGEEYRLGGTTPAAILEMGFMTNGADRAIMFNNPDLVARGVVAGIESYYSTLAEGRRLQAAAERHAETSSFDRSAVILTDNVNIRAGAGTSYRRLDTADFGESFSLMQASNGGRSSNGGWYKIALQGVTGDAYISRDYVVIQQ